MFQLKIQGACYGHNSCVVKYTLLRIPWFRIPCFVYLCFRIPLPVIPGIICHLENWEIQLHLKVETHGVFELDEISRRFLEKCNARVQRIALKSRDLLMSYLW